MSHLFSFLTNRPGVGRLPRFFALAALAATLSTPLASCNKDSDASPSQVQPTTAKPSYAPNENDQMWAVIEQFSAFNDPQLPTLSARQARMTHSVTDAVNALLAKNNRSAPSAAVTVSQLVLPKAYTAASAADGVPVMPDRLTAAIETRFGLVRAG